MPQALIDLPNASLLPHVGSASVHTRNAMADLVVDNLIVVVFRQGAVDAGAGNEACRRREASARAFPFAYVNRAVNAYAAHILVTVAAGTGDS